MASFAANGHPVNLYAYDEVIGVPQGITVLDARKILPENSIFLHKKSGSIAAFADMFRYRLLFEAGGIWADTDMVCLQPFEYDAPEVFGWMEGDLINNAVLGLPKGHAMARWMAECCQDPNRWLPYDDFRTRRRKLKRRLLLNQQGNVAWGEYGPQGLTQAARHFGIADRAQPFWHFYPLHYKQWQAIFDESLANNLEFLGKSKAIHLWNEMFRRDRSFDRNARFPAVSCFEQLWQRYFRNDS